MLPLGLFRSADFMGTNLLTLLLYAALGGGLFFFPLNLIQVQGYGATAAGAALLPFIAIMFLLSRWTGRLVGRWWGLGCLWSSGPLLAAIGFALVRHARHRWRILARPSCPQCACSGSAWRSRSPR